MPGGAELGDKNADVTREAIGSEIESLELGKVAEGGGEAAREVVVGEVEVGERGKLRKAGRDGTVEEVG